MTKNWGTRLDNPVFLEYQTTYRKLYPGKYDTFLQNLANQTGPEMKPFNYNDDRKFSNSYKL